MKKICLLLFLGAICLLVTSCARPVSYYTNPSSAGYNQQKLGGICEYCGRQFNMSGNQLQHLPRIKCPYCGNLSNTKKSAVKWVQVKHRLNQQASERMLLGIVQGAADGLKSHNQTRQSSTVNTYKSSGCSSDFECGIGKKCVKAPLKSRGVCMKTVDEYGVNTYNMPETDSIGVNLDLDGQCSFNTDCPIGFRCDSKYKTCVKR